MDSFEAGDTKEDYNVSKANCGQLYERLISSDGSATFVK